MIATLGLLTPDGLDRFYDIFDDYEHMGDEHRKPSEFLFKELEPYKGQHGAARITWEEQRKHKYREWLKQVSSAPLISLSSSRHAAYRPVDALHPRHLGGWPDANQDQSSGCLGDCGKSWNPTCPCLRGARLN